MANNHKQPDIYESLIERHSDERLSPELTTDPSEWEEEPRGWTDMIDQHHDDEPRGLFQRIKGAFWLWPW